MMVRTAAAAAAFAVACLPLPCSGFLPSQTSHVRPPVAATAPPLFAATTLVDDPSFKRPDTLNDGMISEEACTDAASLMRRVNVPVPTTVSSTGEVGISYIHWAASPADHDPGQHDEVCAKVLEEDPLDALHAPRRPR